MFNWIGLIQVVIIVAMLWLFYRSFIKNTQSEKLVRGLLGLAGLWASSFVLSWVHLDLLAAFLHWTALFLSLSLIVVFQPELRKFMALMGNIQGRGRAIQGYCCAGCDCVCGGVYVGQKDRCIDCVSVFIR